MDNKDDVREFLATRRAKITPHQAGLPVFGGRRRVPGLRREEVAMLAGVSVDYYTRLERGNLGGVSEAVLDALVRALQLDEAERAYLFDLARAANASYRSRRQRPQPRVRPVVQRILDAMTGAPAFVRNARLDIVAANRLGRALYSPVFDSPSNVQGSVNLARFCFFDRAALEFYPEWDEAADATVALLRTEAGRDPYDRSLSDLVGELSTRSDEFRVRWAAHDVRLHLTGTKQLRHPIVGDLTVDFEALDLPAEPGLTLTAYSAEPASLTHDALNLLASWAASSEQPQAATDKR
jgi:transcriptional regulator with XRE-family HTH domain